MKCPKCGCEDFEIAADTHDTCSFLAIINDDGSFDTKESLKENCGDTNYHGNAICCECDCNIVIATGEILEPGVRLLPYSVLLLYPDYIANEFGHETYRAFVYATCAHEAIDAAQKEAIRESPDYTEIANPEDFYPLSVLRWHSNMEGKRQ